MLALALLDTLVQSCGYPIHLQIATKEFLNELVRRFPERPPPFPGPVMQRVLDLIHGWNEGICVDSRWKDDLKNIRDMHHLLILKGYRFRNVPRRQQPTAQELKSAEELEEEDRAAQSAKLQELIRRGTPRDLEAAQELMKSLAGANPDAKPDYRQQALTELNKLESKVILMNEMLDNFDVGRNERFAPGDAYDVRITLMFLFALAYWEDNSQQVATILTSARPKIQKWIEDAETDDPESLGTRLSPIISSPLSNWPSYPDTFLQINDQINTVLTRYGAFKRGDYAAARNPVPAELSAPAAAPSLIDFDDGSSAPAGSSTTNDDFLSLFTPQDSGRSGTPIGGGSIALPSSPSPPGYNPPQAQAFVVPPTQQPQQQAYVPPAQAQQGLGMQTTLGNMGFFGGGSSAGSAQPARTWTPTQQQQQQQGWGATPPSQARTPQLATPFAQTPATGLAQPFGQGSGFIQQQHQPVQPQQQTQAQQQQAQQQNAGQKDPFADLAGLFWLLCLLLFFLLLLC
jgi:ADP-ribosylation factor-binding protein GGA